MSLRLEMAIGPVQGFIQDSRRTRDLWGSSYVLAFLAAHAARGVQRAGGRIVHPLVDEDRLFRWVAGQRDGDPPQMGSLPNHFSVEVNEANACDVARAGVEAVERAWATVCDAVWRRFVEPCASLGAGTKAIWKRQTRAFWEVTWVVGPPPSSGSLPPLARRKLWRSHDAPDEPGDKCTVMPALQELSGHIAARGGRAAQDSFWTRLRSGLGELNVRPNERLSSIALVKRMFPDAGIRALGWRVDANRWPSTKDVAVKGQSSFYAVVAADGDRLGRLVGELGGEGVSRSLARFTRRIDDVVRDHGGDTVYAGGDDVLALLPLPQALSCAQAMEASYRRAFNAAAPDRSPVRQATLSAGVAFAHYKMPLGQVIGEARRLLDDVAKDGNGRDSLAVAVLKPGGLHSQWATAWKRPTPDGEKVRAVDAMARLAEHLSDGESQPGISASLLYRLRKMLSRLAGLDQWHPGSWGRLAPGVDLGALVRAELTQSFAARSKSETPVDQLAEVMLSLFPRARSEGVEETKPLDQIGLDGLMMARFLATGGEES